MILGILNTKERFFTIAFIVSVIICIILVTSLFISHKYNIRSRIENETAVKQLLKRRAELTDELKELKQKLRNLKEIKQDLTKALEEQRRINKLIQEQIEEFKHTKKEMEDKYRKSLNKLKKLKSKLSPSSQQK